jgi:NhaP-type Na+/H+ or K+/H+ antiporter
VARSQIRRTGEQGAGLALAGLILGWVGVGFTVLVLIAAALIAAAAASGGVGG